MSWRRRRLGKFVGESVGGVEQLEFGATCRDWRGGGVFGSGRISVARSVQFPAWIAIDVDAMGGVVYGAILDCSIGGRGRDEANWLWNVT